MERKEGLLKRSGFDIHYWTGGSPTGPLLVFTHGATVDHHEWDITLPVVAEDFRFLTWDVRCHGLSRPAKMSLKDTVADLVDLLDQVNVEQAVFIGHSMGGNLHQELVFHHPERVKALVFLDCTWNFQKLTAFEAFTLRTLAEPLFKMYPYKLLVDQSLAITATTKAAQDVLRPAVELLSKEEYIQIMMEVANCLHFEPGYQINKPILMLMGEKDNTGNIRKAMPLWAAQEPDCSFVVIPGAKHAANLDNPDFFHKTLMDFLLSRGR